MRIQTMSFYLATSYSLRVISIFVILRILRIYFDCSKDKDVIITKENLAEIRNEIREKSNNNNNSKESAEFGDMAAKNILKKYVKLFLKIIFLWHQKNNNKSAKPLKNPY